ncbi:MAG: dioxygenase [Alphaproteobacteria bacterium]|nr:dioxygenase [Alphaproteobacteria bacterium]
MSPRIDPIFVSHGAPTLAAPRLPGEHEVARRLSEIGKAMPQPKAIVVASAHWSTTDPRVGGSERPSTVHDYSGFPEDLYKLSYPAPGAPDIARRVTDLVSEVGFSVAMVPAQGLDHGVWVPLRHMFPAADIPVVPLSIQAQLDPAHHFVLGRALQPLTEEGVLVLGSGGAVHNLRELAWKGGGTTDPWAQGFDEWLAQTLAAGRLEDAVAVSLKAPEYRRAHPTSEHLLPLYVALGAAGAKAKGEALHRGFALGNLSLAAYRFSGAGKPASSRSAA